MPVMMAKSVSNNSNTKSTTTKKVPFKKVFSSSHLQTNGINPRTSGKNSIGSVDFDLNQHKLTSQLSSSLPGLFENLTLGKHKGAKQKESGICLKELTDNSSHNWGLNLSNRAVINQLQNQIPSELLVNNGIPFSAIEPSLIVSLSAYLNTLKNFDSRKLVKEIELMLKYFEDAVKKDKMELLSGSSTILLETVDKNCRELKNAYRQLQQVQLQLQLLSNANLDESEKLDHNQSSPVIEATNDLYRSLSELLQWSDRVCNMRDVTEEIPGAVSDDADTGNSTDNGKEKERTKAHNMETVSTVSAKLLQSFENLAKAYKNMENELRLCYENYLNTNRRIADWILNESNAISDQSIVHSLRRRSVTPPPDYNREVLHDQPNGSLNTISSNSSTSSNNSSNFIFKHRFLPNLITNQAQKMAHQFDFKKLRLKSSQKDAKSDSSSDKHSFFVFPLFGFNSNLKRSESASDISSVTKSYLGIPSDNMPENEQNLSTLARVFRKRSINEPKMHEVYNIVSKLAKSKQANGQNNVSSLNRYSDEIEDRSSKSSISSKEMLFNPLYFTPRFQSQHSFSSDNLVPKTNITPSSSVASTSPPTRNKSHHQLEVTLQNVPLSDAIDKPPPLPPKTYRSDSSTRSSIASNTSSLLKDNDSGIGTMPSTSCDLQKDLPNVLKCPNQNSRISPTSTSPVTVTVNCQSDSTGTNGVTSEYSQVTLRPKKNKMITSNTCTQCHQPIKRNVQRPPSPPPLPAPESYLFGMDSGKESNANVNNPHSDSKCHCLKECRVDKDKENCTCIHFLHPNPNVSEPNYVCYCHCTCGPQRRPVRTYRRQKGQSLSITKAYRSYSIDDTSSTLKYSMTNTSVSGGSQCSSHRSLAHSMSTGDSSLPPPLPPKRRNMHAYMVMVGNYSGPTDCSEMYYYTRVNYSKSMIEPIGNKSARQNSASSSIMSLSSSASSSSSLSTNGSSHNTLLTSHADMDRYQYHHLPMAPPPPTQETSELTSITPPPPLLPPRRDKSAEMTPPLPPPTYRTVQSHSNQNANRASQSLNQNLSPRCSTPVRCIEMGQTYNSDHKCRHSSPFEPNEPVLSFESLGEEVEEEVDDEDEMTPEENVSQPTNLIEENLCCPYCSEGSMHSQEECILSQIDVPTDQLLFKLPDEEDDTFDDLDIRGGTIDALLIKANQASSSGADATFLDAFLTTHRAFCTPHQLINKLIFRYNQFTSHLERTDIVRQAVARKVVEFIILLFNEIYVFDFNRSLSQILMEFIYQLVGRGELAHAKCLREKCYEKIRQRDREFAGVMGATTKPVTHNLTTRTTSLLDFKSEHLAEQMTLLDSRLFHKIEIPEILIWAKEQKEELIPNLSTFTEHFNKMSFWTRSQILRCEDHKEREKYVLKFLKIMKHLRKLNNFNSYLAILSALCSAPISRLDWQKSITETLKEYNALIDSSSSFRTYRTALAMAKPPCIPYIGLILQDLTFVHVGNSDYLPDGKINFSKHSKQYNILRQMRQFKQCKYSINENEQIVCFFDNFNDYLQEEVMWQISESIKPRGGSGGGNSTLNSNNTTGNLS